MNRHHEPNASYYSARYAERKRAAERARDAAAGPPPCAHCATTAAPGSVFCPDHAAQFAVMRTAETPIETVLAFCQRTYWP